MKICSNLATIEWSQNSENFAIFKKIEIKIIDYEIALIKCDYNSSSIQMKTKHLHNKNHRFYIP